MSGVSLLSTSEQRFRSQIGVGDEITNAPLLSMELRRP